MSGLLDLLDGASRLFGRAVAWLLLLMGLTVVVVVVLRYGFSLGWPWLQEGYVYLHAAAFMLGAAWTLLIGGHTRVDVVYGRLTDRGRAWVDLLGHVFLLWPMTLQLLVSSWPYAADSWMRLEGSRVADGAPGVFLVKSTIPAFCILLLLQSLSLALRALLRICGRDGRRPA